MKAYLLTIPVGVIAVDEKKKVLETYFFPKDPKLAATKFLSSEEGKIIKEEKKVKDFLEKKGYEVVFLKKKKGERFEENVEIEDWVRENLIKILLEKNFAKDVLEVNELLSKINLVISRERIRKSARRDRLVIQATNALEELDKIINILAQRLREFYSFHFPEMDREVSSHERFAKLVEKYGRRENVDDPSLKRLAEESVGGEFRNTDVEICRKLAKELLNLYTLRESVSEYVEKTVRELAPNFTELATPLIAAKLIAKAGSLEKIAKMASSTLQLVGAEKALFRYLRGKGKSPRFGVLAIHPLIQRAPEKLKGKVARVLAAKLSMAAKIDFYSKENKAEKLKRELEKKLEEIVST